MEGGASDGTTLWFVNDTTDNAVAYNLDVMDESTRVVTGGSTYTTQGDTDGYVLQQISGISNNAVLCNHDNQPRFRGSLSSVLGVSNGS